MLGFGRWPFLGLWVLHFGFRIFVFGIQVKVPQTELRYDGVLTDLYKRGLGRSAAPALAAADHFA